jgi:hypothetical protein
LRFGNDAGNLAILPAARDRKVDRRGGNPLMLAMRVSPSNQDECAGRRNGKERSIHRLPVLARVAVARLSCTLDFLPGSERFYVQRNFRRGTA